MYKLMKGLFHNLYDTARWHAIYWEELLLTLARQSKGVEDKNVTSCAVVCCYYCCCNFEPIVKGVSGLPPFIMAL